MRVCLVNALFYPFSGGVEKHMLDLGRHLVKLGVEVHVLTGRLGDSLEEETIDGIRVHRIACTEVRIPRFYPPPLILAPNVQEKLAKLDSEYRFDLFHLQNRWFPDFDSTLFYARAANKPFVVTLHNARPVGIALHYTVLGGLYDEVIGKSVLKSADRIISVSRWAIGDVSKYGISKSKFTPIPNGIEASDYVCCTDPIAARKKPIRKRLGLGEGPLLLFVGRVIRQKGLDYMISAMPAIIKGQPKAKFVIVGKGDKLGELKEQVEKLGLEESVVFTGFVSDKELKSLLAASDIFVLPSLWEVLPIAVLEGMASGKPIVCTDAGGNRELVDSRNGKVVPKRSQTALVKAVLKLLSDPQTMRKMGAWSRRKAIEEFNWTKIAQKTIVVYQQVIAQKKASKASNTKGLQLVRARLRELRSRFGVLYSADEMNRKNFMKGVNKSLEMLPVKMKKLIAADKKKRRS